jgi:hypothetical protein
MEYSETTKKFLLQAGWFPERKIDISSYEQLLYSKGYELNDIVKEFLSEFGELKISFPNHVNSSMTDDIVFHTIEAIIGIFHEKVEIYQERVGEKLVTIGEAYNGNMVVLMSLSGKFYGAYDDLVVYYGENRYEALEAICEWKDTPEIK